MHWRLCGCLCVLGALTFTGCSKNTVQPPVAARPAIPPLPCPPDQIVKAEPGPPLKPSAQLCLKAGEVKEALGDDSKDAKMRDQHYLQAKGAYLQALEQDANFKPARIRLARIHEKLGEPHQTVAMFQEALNKNPNDAAVWYELGMCYGRQRHWDSGIQCLQKAVTLDPNNASYGSHLGFALARAGRYDESFEYFRVSMGEAQAHLNVGKMLHHVGQQEQARQHLMMAARLDPQLMEAQRTLASMNQGSGVIQVSAPAP